jgi:hypothetical protein
MSAGFFAQWVRPCTAAAAMSSETRSASDPYAMRIAVTGRRG